MTVAVLGAGLLGVGVALELARRGVRVELFDRNEACLTQAGLWNEGKLHLGFVYANDPSFATAALVARGSLAFGGIVGRWLEQDPGEIASARPFYYAVHRESLIFPDAIEAHCRRVASHARELASAEGWNYLGRAPENDAERLAPTAAARMFDPAQIQAAFRTGERSVDPAALAQSLRARVATEKLIAFHPRTVVTGATLRESGVEVRLESNGVERAERFDHVVNALWDGRIALDATAGLAPLRPWLHRLKYAIRLELPVAMTDDVPSATIMLGRYGDIVNFGHGRLYLSWYPACLAGLSAEVQPPAWPRQPPPDDAKRILDESWQCLAKIAPSLRALSPTQATSREIHGGIIVAAGETDIDDPASGLHRRTAIGIYSRGVYHSVDPGKYCLAPLFAVEVADRIAPPA